MHCSVFVLLAVFVFFFGCRCNYWKVTEIGLPTGRSCGSLVVPPAGSRLTESGGTASTDLCCLAISRERSVVSVFCFVLFFQLWRRAKVTYTNTYSRGNFSKARPILRLIARSEANAWRHTTNGCLDLHMNECRVHRLQLVCLQLGDELTTQFTCVASSKGLSGFRVGDGACGEQP